MSHHTLKKLLNHYLSEGIELCEKKSGGFRYNTKAFTAEDVKRTVTYITNFAETNAMVIPGRVPGVKTSDPRVRILPSAENKSKVWRKYKRDLEELKNRTGDGKFLLLLLLFYFSSLTYRNIPQNALSLLDKFLNIYHSGM